MTVYQYKVMPFIGQIKGNQNVGEVSTQLQNEINEGSQNGWEFFQLSDAQIEVKPGCLSGLFGSKVTYIKLDQLIFKKEA